MELQIVRKEQFLSDTFRRRQTGGCRDDPGIAIDWPHDLMHFITEHWWCVFMLLLHLMHLIHTDHNALVKHLHHKTMRGRFIKLVSFPSSCLLTKETSRHFNVSLSLYHVSVSEIHRSICSLTWSKMYIVLVPWFFFFVQVPKTPRRTYPESWPASERLKSFLRAT